MHGNGTSSSHRSRAPHRPTSSPSTLATTRPNDEAKRNRDQESKRRNQRRPPDHNRKTFESCVLYLSNQICPYMVVANSLTESILIRSSLARYPTRRTMTRTWRHESKRCWGRARPSSRRPGTSGTTLLTWTPRNSACTGTRSPARETTLG